MNYEEKAPIPRDRAIVELESEDAERVARALVRVAFHERDRAWVEDLLATHLQSDDPWVRGVAATCAGHVARVHRMLNTTRLVPLIEALASDQSTIGRMEDALEDIEMFVGTGRRSADD